MKEKKNWFVKAALFVILFFALLLASFYLRMIMGW
jgi:hypothetical protein